LNSKVTALVGFLLISALVLAPSPAAVTSGSVGTFQFRIADFMADILVPDFDSQFEADIWQLALDDLRQASPNGEITHVQMRIWETYAIDNDTGGIVVPPHLGSSDYEQNRVMQNWQRWYFGFGDPLIYGPSAAERIHNAGFNMEFSISVAWDQTNRNTITDNTRVFAWGARESDFPLFDGELYLQYYMDNVLRPTAQFLASNPNFVSGDIFMLALEMVYPTADFTWNHNSQWFTMINETRQIFQNAGKDILLTVDHAGWFDDEGLGYNAVKQLNPEAPITSDRKGISGATYLGDLDFVSVSWWLPLVLASEVPSTWSERDISWVTEAWFNNKNFDKVGTGYNGTLRIAGRNMIADMRALATVMNKRILLNTGWENRHGFIASSPRGGSNITDPLEQKLAWMSQLIALGDKARSKPEQWLAGQDFERYTRDKSLFPDYIDTSWWNAPAQSAIMAEIRAIQSGTARARLTGDWQNLSLRTDWRWLTAYIQPLQGYNASDINATGILLTGTISPVLDPQYSFVTNSSEYLSDYDNDGFLERMVKFDRASVESWIYHNQSIRYGNFTLTLAGRLFDGTPFECEDVVFVNYAGDANNDGAISVVDLHRVGVNWTGYDANTDFNNDGIVNIFDIRILNTNLGQTTP